MNIEIALCCPVCGKTPFVYRQVRMFGGKIPIYRATHECKTNKDGVRLIIDLDLDSWNKRTTLGLT